MGGLRTEIPFTYWMMVIGTLALTGVGIPFTSIGFAGFVSKDRDHRSGLRLAAARRGLRLPLRRRRRGLTSFYSWRLMFMTFFGERGDWAAGAATDAPPMATTPCRRPRRIDRRRVHGHGASTLGARIAAGDAGPARRRWRSAPSFAGVVFRHWFIGGGFEGFWKDALFLGAGQPHPRGDGDASLALVSLLPTLMMLGGFAVAYLHVHRRPRRAGARSPRQSRLLYRFLLNKWYFDELYDFLFVRPAFWLGRLFWKGGDGVDHRRPRPRRRLGARARRDAQRRAAADAATSTTTPSRCCSASRAFATWYLFGGIR